MISSVLIIGGGISGLATAYSLKARRPELEVTVLEKEPVVGGKVRSEMISGYTVDWGPNGFLNVPETLELVRSLGLEDVSAADAAKHRFLYRDGGLRILPTSPPAFLKSELLTLSAKLRAAAEIFSKPHDGEETVYAFAARHFGKAFAETLAEPMVLGVSAGDAREVSLDALFPRVRELERQHGSLVRALLHMQKARRNSRSRLTSFRGGMQRLIDGLDAQLDASVKTGSSATGFKALPEGGYEVALEIGETLAADAAILSTPAFVSAKLLKPLAPEAAEALSQIPYAGVWVFALGYDRIDVPNALDGFGFLVPRGEGLRILGVLYTSSIFIDQAPEGKVLLRVIAGGSVDPDFLGLPYEEALAVVKRDLEVSLGITAEPEMIRHIAWPQGIPQYLLGHGERVARIMSALPPGLYLTGNAYYGVGLNDCVRDARRIADEISKAG